jgi:hypothetical protein
VLAGAVALSALSGSWFGGLAMGLAYLAGIVLPLVILAIVFSGAKKKVRDPKFTLALGSYRKRISLSRLVGTAVFTASGLFFIGLAFAGESKTGPAFQRWIGAQLNRHLATHAGQVPNWIAWPALALFTLTLIFLVLKPGQKEQTS